jgi:hypothetical protein
MHKEEKMEEPEEKQEYPKDEQSYCDFREIKRAMRIAAKNCALSREQIVDAMNEIISLEGLRTRGRDGKLTKAILDKWLAPEAEDVIPLKLLAAFCRITNSLSPLQTLAAPLGAKVIGQAEQLLLEFGRAQVNEREARRRKRRLSEEYEELKKRESF